MSCLWLFRHGNPEFGFVTWGSIGSVSFETRKQFGPRTSLSLWSDYEYISSVPEMHYSNGDRPTRIDEDGAFATRTMLR